MVRWMRWHCQERYILVTEVPHNIESLRVSGEENFVSLKLNGQSEVRTRVPSRLYLLHQCPPPPVHYSVVRKAFMSRHRNIRLTRFNFHNIRTLLWFGFFMLLKAKLIGLSLIFYQNHITEVVLVSSKLVQLVDSDIPSNTSDTNPIRPQCDDLSTYFFVHRTDIGTLLEVEGKSFHAHRQSSVPLIQLSPAPACTVYILIGRVLSIEIGRL